MSHPCRPLTPPPPPPPSPLAPRLFEDKARELQISDLPGFYSSDTFKGQGFKLDQGAASIVFNG